MKIIINNQPFNLKKAHSFKTRLKGLMLQKHIQEGLFLPNCHSIHTFFMKEAIDIIMINKIGQIVLIKRNVPANQIIYKKEAQHTIELPANSINNLTLNETLTIID